MGILGGSDIERIQSDININFYMQDIITNKANGYVMPNEEIFAKVLMQRETYRSPALMSAIGSSIGNPLVSDNSRELFRQKAIEFVDDWGNSPPIPFYVLQAFCAIGASLYTVRDKISIDWAIPSAQSSNLFNVNPLFLYLCGVISKTQWFRSKQGFVGSKPEPVASYDRFYMWTRYDTSSSYLFTVFNSVGYGDDITELTLGGYNVFASGASSYTVDLGYDYRHVTWGKGSEMRRLSDNFLKEKATNKNLVKLMIPRYREYLAPVGASNVGGFQFKVDEEASLIYQPSIIEMAGVKNAGTVSPSIPQTKFQYFSSSPSNAASNLRVILNSSSAQPYALRDCENIDGQSNQFRRIVTETGVITWSNTFSTLYVPVFFDLQLPMWCM